MRVVFGRVPPSKDGGFHFPQKLRSGDTQYITASTKDALDKEVLRFRVVNGLDTGDPPKETNDYLCERFPQICSETRSTEADESVGSLRQRATNWRYNRYAESQRDHTLVDDTEAQRRASVCAECPWRQDNRTGCKPCVVENDRYFFMLRGGKDSPVPNLGGCSITGQDNATAVFLPKSRLNYAKKYVNELTQNKPDCWLLQELTNGSPPERQDS